MSEPRVRIPWRSVAIGLLVGGAFIAYLAQRSDWREVWRTAARADLWHVLGIAAATLGFLAVKTWRWRLLLARTMPRAPGGLFPSVALGSAANYGVPHLGELVRAAIVRRDTGTPLGTVLASIVAERVLDVVAMALAAITLGLAFPGNARLAEAARLVGLGGALLLLGVLLVLAQPGWVLRMFGRVVSVLPTAVGTRLSQAARNGIAGLAPLGNGPTLAGTLLLSALQWTLMAGGIAVALHSAGIEVTIAATAATLVFSVVGLMLPSAPGYAGTTQVAFLWALTSVGVSETSSLAASVVYNTLVVATVVSIAALVALRSRPPQHA